MLAIIQNFGLFSTFSLNFCLIIDLIKMMRDPFSDKEKYMNYYLIISPIVSLGLAIWSQMLVQNQDNSPITSYIIFIWFISMFTLGIYSVYLAHKVLSKPGISGAARNLILKRHVITISIFFICNIYIFAYTFYDIFRIGLDQKTKPVW
jgi:hypothetical protein